MLIIDLQEMSFFNEETNTFIDTKPMTVKMEHSLISISKWESIWEEPFITETGDSTSTYVKWKSYVECMIIGSVPDHVLEVLARMYVKEIQNYIESPNSATKIKEPESGRKSSTYLSSELIYYFMIRFGIPIKAEMWHLNRLLMLIKICEIKEKDQKMSKKDLYKRNRSLNAARKAKR